MTPEGAIGAPDAPNIANVSTSTVADSSSASGTFSAPSEQSAGPANAENVQGQSPIQQEADPFAGVPSVDELTRLAEQGTPHAKSLIQLRQALESRNTQYNDLEPKYKAIEPFQPFIERFEKPEDLQQIVDFREQLFGWETDLHTGQLVPATQSLVKNLPPERADFLSADLLNGMTRDPDTGREMTRMDLALEAIREDPDRRAKALQILGAVDPDSISSPTFAPTEAELQDIRPELHDIYKKLPYEQRQKMLGADPDLVNDRLEDIKFKADVRERDARQEAQQRQVAQQREQYIKTEAENAGNQLVQQGFVEGFTGFANNICERYQPIKPLDPQSPEAQQMAPEQVQATNAQIQKINQGAGRMVAMITAGLAHPETQFLFAPLAKELGITDEMLQKFDQSRLEFAANSRNFGNLRFRANLGQNGNGLPQDIGMLQIEAQRAQRRLLAHGNAIAEPIQKMLSEFFSLQAQSHNQTLNGATQARPAISGTGYDPTQVAQQRPRATTEAEIMQRARESANAIAARR